MIQNQMMIIAIIVFLENRFFILFFIYVNKLNLLLFNYYNLKLLLFKKQIK